MSGGSVQPPEPDSDTIGYWESLAEGQLRIQRCLQCQRYQHFPSPICSSCLSFELRFDQVSGRGTVYSYVVIHHVTNAAFAERSPYAVAWVELVEQRGLKVLSDIVGCSLEALEIGLDVELVLDSSTIHDAVLPRFRAVREGIASD